MKVIRIENIVDENSLFLRDGYNADAVERYAEMYLAGKTKPIVVSKIGADKYKIVDGFHRVKACKKIDQKKVDAEVIEVDDRDAFAMAVEENLKHGIVLTKPERQKALWHLMVDDGRTQEQVGKIFKVSQQAVTKWVNSDKTLVLQLSSKTNNSVVNEVLKGLKQQEIAKSYGITQGRVSQIKDQFFEDVLGDLDRGLIFSEIKNNYKNIEFPEDWLEKNFKESKLVLGNCLKQLHELQDNSIDCVVTDPPYGQQYCSHRSKNRSFKNKPLIGDDEQANNLLEKSLSILSKKCKKDAHLYIFCSWKTYPAFAKTISKYFNIKSCLVWIKNVHGMGNLKNFAEKYELVVFASNGKRQFNEFEDRPVNVFFADKFSGKNHPTEKPVDLLSKFISLSSKEGELIADPFVGSGSTAVAARQVGRRWWGCEIDEEYYDISKKRIFGDEAK